MSIRAEVATIAPRPGNAARTLHVGVIGPGRVGRALLHQLRTAAPRLQRQTGIELRLRGIAARDALWCDDDTAWPELSAEGAPGQPCERPLDRLRARLGDVPHAVLVDCSASDEVAAQYPQWLHAGLHVVTPNKHLGSGPLPRWQAAREATAQGHAALRCETTVCAGLPVLQPLRDMLDTGDELIAVEGMLSGTLAWLLDGYDGRQPFAGRVLEAQRLGYTEPDPREDLCGMDVARKLVILAREAGHPLELADVDIETLVPPALAAMDRADFLQHLQLLDEPMAQAAAKARADGRVLRYVAHLERGKRPQVGLRALAPDHPFAHARGTDNIVRIRSARYDKEPLVVQGPGAGPEVTAAGVFADVLRVAGRIAPSLA